MTRLKLVIVLAVGAGAAAVAWSHVLDLARDHQQGAGHTEWVVAACIELAAIWAGLEILDRRRGGHRLGPLPWVLAASVLLQLSAQVAQAERTPWGVILAAVPAVTFLTLAKFTLARPGASRRRMLTTSRAEMNRSSVKASEAEPEPARGVVPTPAPAEPDPTESAPPDELFVARAKAAGKAIAERGDRLNRDNMRRELRCNNGDAGAAVRAVKAG